MSEQTRVREFSRTYAYENGVATVKDSKGNTVAEIVLTEIAANIVNGFALQRVSQYVVNAARAAIEAGEDVADAIAEALGELKSGDIDLRDGAGVGVASATRQLAAILVELGKSQIKFAGKEYNFTTPKEAETVLRSLWNENPQVMRGDKPFTGRELINALKAQPEVKARMVKREKKAQKLDDFLG